MKGISDYRVQLRENNLLTMFSIAVVAYYFQVMPHEILGHGIPMYLFGHREFLLTSTSIDNLDKVSHYAGGQMLAWIIIASGGAFLNVVLGLALGLLFLKMVRRKCSGQLAYFLWSCAAVNMFAGVVYPGFSGIFGVGDFAYASQIDNAFYRTSFRVIEILFSIFACGLTVKLSAAALRKFSGGLYRLTIPSYVFSSMVFILLGLRMHNYYLLIISTIPSTLLSMAPWPLAAMVSKGRGNEAQIEPIPFSWFWLALAVMCIVAIIFTAPGLHIHL